MIKLYTEKSCLPFQLNDKPGALINISFTGPRLHTDTDSLSWENKMLTSNLWEAGQVWGVRCNISLIGCVVQLVMFRYLRWKYTERERERELRHSPAGHWSDHAMASTTCSPALISLLWWDWSQAWPANKILQSINIPPPENKSTFLDVWTENVKKSLRRGGRLPDRRKWNKSLTELNWEIVYKLERRDYFYTMNTTSRGC